METRLPNEDEVIVKKKNNRNLKIYAILVSFICITQCSSNNSDPWKAFVRPENHLSEQEFFTKLTSGESMPVEEFVYHGVMKSNNYEDNFLKNATMLYFNNVSDSEKISILLNESNIIRSLQNTKPLD